MTGVSKQAQAVDGLSSPTKMALVRAAARSVRGAAPYPRAPKAKRASAGRSKCAGRGRQGMHARRAQRERCKSASIVMRALMMRLPSASNAFAPPDMTLAAARAACSARSKLSRIVFRVERGTKTSSPAPRRIVGVACTMSVEDDAAAAATCNSFLTLASGLCAAKETKATWSPQQATPFAKERPKRPCRWRVASLSDHVVGK